MMLLENTMKLGSQAKKPKYKKGDRFGALEILKDAERRSMPTGTGRREWVYLVRWHCCDAPDQELNQAAIVRRLKQEPVVCTKCAVARSRPRAKNPVTESAVSDRDVSQMRW